MPPLPAVPTLFNQKKASILRDLAVPEASYTDLSPKGSIDIGIKDLIDRINGLDGVVTTSSCAGRISVFLEGSKATDADHTHNLAADGVWQETLKEDANAGSEGRHSIVPGGKGPGGRWLLVSHDPVGIPVQQEAADTPVSRMFGLSPLERMKPFPNLASRLIKFQFEPMILHIMAASLHHAKRLLAAAINAGFRESGVQSLKNLDDSNSFPMVAVRTSGLAFSSLVGFLTYQEEGREVLQSMVDENHLRLLLNLGNSRFKANADRINRFEKNLFESNQASNGSREDPMLRRQRKRADGLKDRTRVKQQRAGKERASGSVNHQVSDEDPDSLEGLGL